jgi:hypothetical protein
MGDIIRFAEASLVDLFASLTELYGLFASEPDWS